MSYQTNLKSSGFRDLNPNELDAVSGGNYLVTAPRPSSGNLWSGSGDGAGGLGSGLSAFQFMDPGLLGTFDLDAFMDLFEEPDPDTGMTDGQEEATKEVAKAFIDQFEAELEKNPNQTVEMPDGRLVKLVDIIGGLQKVIKGIEAGTFVVDLATGDANLRDAIYIAFGITVTGAASAAGAPAGVAALIGFAAQGFAQNALTIGEWVNDRIITPAEQAFIEQTRNAANQMPNNGANNNVEFMRGIFGTNDPYGNSNEP